MLDQLDKIDIEILYQLYAHNVISPMVSFQIKNLIELKDSETSSVSYYTLVRRLAKLIELGMVDLGYKVSNAKTYYINNNGIQYLQNGILSSSDVYEDIVEEVEIINNNDISE